ncbi:glycosyl transferase family 90 [Aidingimonas halophila]|uniref:Glycosyl transferase family 90 n=1 Tax=Aidingimonas halophila TaxID=574349 RepID=A0A1H3GAD4_9GAMM|nr:glycosyl transferase family 90 [Aidingimonas halophila]GHC32721.1 LPS A protein [Aidingimonas halophila]SDX99289.1 Glycosyl transferase family 90 [Aidingimonas halophila]
MSTRSGYGSIPHRLRFYLGEASSLIIPDIYFRKRRDVLLSRFDGLNNETQKAIVDRVDYCNKLTSAFNAEALDQFNRDLTIGTRRSAYHLDFKRVARYFPADVRFSYLFGDCTHVPDEPTFVKSRPVADGAGNADSVLLKLNSVRHYYRVRDRLAFEQKRPLAVWRGSIHQGHRKRFVASHFAHPLCNIGAVGGDPDGLYDRGTLSIREQLQYRFIISIEGKDVATNLKWILSSNSLCLMPRPRYETWFMEGRLIPGVHYVQVADDFSDLGDKIEHYLVHPAEAKAIIANANRHAESFYDSDSDLLVSLMVFDKYLRLSGQLPRWQSSLDPA